MAIAKRVLVFMLICFLAIMVATLYGILHDQLTYTISYEYYTKFKFIQFELYQGNGEAIFSHPRVQVSIVGALATFWMGIPIGITLGLIGLVHSQWKDMLSITLKAFVVVVIVTLLTGLIGLGYGFYQANYNFSAFTINWLLPVNLTHPKIFVAVGSMHNFSYLGGTLGLIAACVYSLSRRKEGLLLFMRKTRWRARQ